ncbi:hypothetical protein GQ464_003565 [Rhodocaloribacter litoris]|uniref:hypothetical protein n=1 Tax=Rhodocaloribacter litoris TaxID=2558931 RepID=UPI00141FEB82|nr:hypothetical protein [Rhodocaloribacter litoris]QXD16038.1 hypothetical protein GQ464_003565 [Rhodocaloribacter litoris]
MSNRINPYRSPLLQPHQRTEPLRETPRAPQAAALAPARQHTAARPALEQIPLSAEEQQMIDREFPPRPALTLRLYGPGRQGQTVNPAALGTRLDVRG